MRRIGIITSYGIPNYGSFLQAYALRNVIEKITSDDVQLIRYQNKVHLQAYYSPFPIGYKKKYINPHYYLTLFRRLIKIKYFNELRKAWKKYYFMIPGTGSLDEKKLQEETFNIVVLGSDIIWDFTIEIFGEDPFLFGNDLKAEKIVSYAASFGTAKVGMEYPDYVINGLKKLDEISVRDLNSQTVVEDICSRKATLVLDPTFLWDFKNDINVQKYSNRNLHDYIFVYGGNFSEAFKNQAKKYANSKNYKLVCVEDENYSWCDVCLNEFETNPFEWTNLVKNAKAVLTSTFHGLMFSLQFEKKIAFQPTDFILNKVDDFLKYLDIYSVLTSNYAVEEQLEWIWNYIEINKKLSILKKISLDFLSTELEDKSE